MVRFIGDPAGEKSSGKGLPDSVTVIEPKEEQPAGAPSSQDYGAKAAQAAQLQQQQQDARAQEQEGEGPPGGDAPAQEGEGGGEY